MSVYELKNGVITCIMEKSYNGYNLTSIRLEQEPNTLYTVGRYIRDNDDLNYCNVTEYLEEKLKRTIDSQLKAYVNAHVYRYDFYKIMNDGCVSKFYSNFVDSINVQIPQPEFYFSFNDFINGIISVTLDGKEIQYSFLNHQIQADLPLFFMMYKDKLNYILAQEQLRLGIAPPAFTELSNLNDALKDKQTVTIVFKDNDPITLRKSCFHVRDLFVLNVSNERINCRFNRWGFDCLEGKDIDDVDYFKLGKTKYQFNIDNLEKLYEPEETTTESIWMAA